MCIRIRSNAKRTAKRIRLIGLPREEIKALNQRKKEQEILLDDIATSKKYS